MSESISVTISRQNAYRFLVDFGAAIPAVSADLPPPLGQGTGPSPEHLLLSAIANCLCASLVFALQKYQQDPGTVHATATATIDRNEARRLRVTRVAVDIQLEKPAADLSHLDRVLAQFESFCTVTESVRAGVPVSVSVRDAGGQRLGA